MLLLSMAQYGSWRDEALMMWYEEQLVSLWEGCSCGLTAPREIAWGFLCGQIYPQAKRFAPENGFPQPILSNALKEQVSRCPDTL